MPRVESHCGGHRTLRELCGGCRAAGDDRGNGGWQCRSGDRGLALCCCAALNQYVPNACKNAVSTIIVKAECYIH